jgi:hypothetical protein
VFVAIGPDAEVLLLGQDTVVRSPMRNTPQIERVNAVLARYHLARQSPSGIRQRLEVANLLMGAGRSAGITYRRCPHKEEAVIAVVENDYERSSTEFVFTADGRLADVIRREGTSVEC